MVWGRVGSTRENRQLPTGPHRPANLVSEGVSRALQAAAGAIKVAFDCLCCTVNAAVRHGPQ